MLKLPNHKVKKRGFTHTPIFFLNKFEKWFDSLFSKKINSFVFSNNMFRTKRKLVSGFTHTLNFVSNKFRTLFFGVLSKKLQRVFCTKNNVITKRKLVSGFTIIELIVTTAIFALITTLMLVKDSQFNNSVKLGNLAYEIAIAVRQAQVFGTGVKEFGSGNFNVGYGIHFDIANGKNFVFFADENGNGSYDGSTEMIELINMRGNNFVSKFCVFRSNGDETCSESDSKLDVIFKRPNHNAIISTNLGLGLYESARIFLSSTTGDEKSVLIKYVGQISVE